MTNYIATIDKYGISAKTYSEILSDLQADYRVIYGDDTYLEADSQDGQFLALLASAINDANNALVLAYNNQSPATAIGAGLSNVVQINGLKREIATYSEVIVRLVGRAGTIISSGIVADKDTQTQWLLPATVEIPLSGEINVTAICRTEGAIQARANSIVNIITPVLGWQEVNNPDPAVIGAAIETDAKLRRRQTRSTSLPAITPRESIEAAVGNIIEVKRVKVFENDKNYIDDNGLLPNSISIVFEGGSIDDIAKAVALKKNPGTATFGSVQVLVFDSHGVPNTINLNPLNLIPIYYKITIKPLSGYTTSTGDKILSAISEYLNHLDIAEDLFISRLWSPANLNGQAAQDATGLLQSELDKLSDTYVIKTIEIGRDEDNLTDDDISISLDEAVSGAITNGQLVLL